MLVVVNPLLLAAAVPRANKLWLGRELVSYLRKYARTPSFFQSYSRGLHLVVLQQHLASSRSYSSYSASYA